MHDPLRGTKGEMRSSVVHFHFHFGHLVASSALDSFVALSIDLWGRRKDGCGDEKKILSRWAFIISMGGHLL